MHSHGALQAAASWPQVGAWGSEPGAAYVWTPRSLKFWVHLRNENGQQSADAAAVGRTGVVPGFRARSLLLPWCWASDAVRRKHLLHNVGEGMTAWKKQRHQEELHRSSAFGMLFFKRSWFLPPTPDILKFSRTNIVGKHLLLTLWKAMLLSYQPGWLRETYVKEGQESSRLDGIWGIPHFGVMMLGWHDACWCSPLPGLVLGALLPKLTLAAIIQHYRWPFDLRVFLFLGASLWSSASLTSLGSVLGV